MKSSTMYKILGIIICFAFAVSLFKTYLDSNFEMLNARADANFNFTRCVALSQKGLADLMIYKQATTTLKNGYTIIYPENYVNCATK